MKKLTISALLTLSILFLAASLRAQAPTVTWDDFYPTDYASGNYTANVIIETPSGEIVVVGNLRFASQTYPHNDVLVMRLNNDGSTIWVKSYGGIKIDSVLVGQDEYQSVEVPWDQEAYDMYLTQEGNYLITGFRDTTSHNASTPAGLLLLEISPSGEVITDTLMYNFNQDVLIGRSIQPDINYGCVIVGSFREEGSGTEKTLLLALVKDENGIYRSKNYPIIGTVPVGQSGYASWIRPFGDGYMIAGSAYREDTGFDLFLRKTNDALYAGWTEFYGMKDNDGFSDGLVSGDKVYLAGYVEDSVPNTSFTVDQIYVVKAGADGSIIWEETYGGPTQHYANSIMMTGDGNLMVAGTAYDLSMHTEMVLLKIDAETGDSLWMQSYGTNFTNAGTRDAARAADFGYILAGRASYTSQQDPRMYIMNLDNPATADLFLAREDLNLDIVTTTPTKDVIDVTADKLSLYGVRVTIDRLLHPSVGDLELTLEHGGTTVTLVDQPFHSGENFIHTALIDAAELPVESGFAPYSGWFRPEEPLFPFLFSDPTGEWTLTVTDHGTGGVKATSRVLEGWSLNLLTEAGSGVGIPSQEALANFGLESIRPNPLNQEAQISFQIPEPGHVNLVVYNQLGQQVARLAEEVLPAGIHTKIWNPGALAPGAYFLQLESGGRISVRKAMIAK
jgi:hypothetical protein